MKDIRIGNDISVRWSLYKGDEAYDLTNLPVTLYLKNAYGKKEIKDYTIEGNQISWTFYGKDQKNTGKYSMVLVIREGEQGMASTDYCDFVQLVSCACQVSGMDEENVQTETIELTSEVDFPPIIVDTSLSEVSGNPIANMAVAKAFATQAESIKNKVDKVEGKGLSTNDYTTAEKNKLAGLQNYNDTEIKQELTELSGSLAGDYFTIKGMYLVAAYGTVSPTANPNAVTDFIDISKVERIQVRGRSGSAVALVAFYDENKTFISSIYGIEYSDKLVTIPKSDFPTNAKYIRANGNNNDNDLLIAESIYSVSQSLNVLKSANSPLRAYVTGTLDNLIVIDTTAKTVSFPNPAATLILSEKHGLKNPTNTEALDASALGNNYFILFDFIASKFILAPVNFANNPEYKDCGVVAAVSAGQKRVPYINADSYIFNGVSYKKTFAEKEDGEEETNDVYGNAFIKKGYFVWANSGEISTTSNPSATTDFLDIRGVEQIIVKGRSGSAVALVAFYDENKTFISSIFGNEYSKKLITITSAEIPTDAHYMVATGVGDGTDFLQITSLNDLYMRLQNVEKSKQPINLSAILTMGASLMYNGNGWVEDGCSIVGVTPYNKAASGVGVPSYFANQIWNGTYCTDEEFENADILAIQFASSTNMYIENNTKSIEDYESALDTSAANPFESLSHAECLDYILKKWQKKCYEQKDNPNSKWYGTQYGKPCSLLFVTHWHDGRTNYNETIRQVAAKWGGCVCEFDKKIGFSKNQTLPDGRQPSIIYAVDTQVLDGVTYGWHPLRGDAGKKYIQRKMANIFADTIKECYSLYL